MIIEDINSPKDLKKLSLDQLKILSQEIRQKLILTVSSTGGHLASSLGCVELAIALHYVFDSPTDKIIWDTGHQAYAHKILTGRKEKFYSLRQYMGLSGFLTRKESEHDIFGAGHAGTSVSAALGIAVARDLKKENYKVISVTSDGALTCGMTMEAIQNAGALQTDILVILNDNGIFISHRVGAIGAFLTKLLTFGTVRSFEKKVENFLKKLPLYISWRLLRFLKRTRVILFPGMIFEEFKFSYFGPIDGHDLPVLIDTLNRLKNFNNPVLLHIVTKKGKGYPFAEKQPIKYHGVSKFDPITGEVKKSDKKTYTDIFSQTLIKISKEDKKIIAITAAMPEGTGLDRFKDLFPERFFDVGIGEQHAVTFAAGLAVNGLKPVVAIYSTFLQRAFDQIIHDVALQELPVVFCLDRAGIVGEDGPTHHGCFDLSYLNLIPNLIIMSPADENELQHILYTALNLNKPVAIRYPRGECIGVRLDEEFKSLTVGKGEIIIDGRDVFIISIGNMVHPSIKASEILKNKNISAGVANLRFLKPLDERMILEITKKTKIIVTVEENVLEGGMGSQVRKFVEDCKVFNIGLPDEFIQHGKPEILRNIYNLTPEKISEFIVDKIKNM